MQERQHVRQLGNWDGPDIESRGVATSRARCVLRNAAPLDVWKLYRERLAADSAVRLGSYPFATEAQPVYEEINAEYPGVRCLCHTPPARCRRSKETTRR